MHTAAALIKYMDDREHVARALAAVAAQHRANGDVKAARTVDRFAAWAFAQAVGISLMLGGIKATWTVRPDDPRSHGVTLPDGLFVPTRPHAKTAALVLNGTRVRRVRLHGSDSARYVSAVIWEAMQKLGSPAADHPDAVA
ncbi:hypothetical protein CFP71_42755 [Amycolatopsis thailandensis]|uniref:Uncharacterized protein n=1 Tax=Amycolatopsis thailandensis TaxID=589330 RepID=A0A229R3P5_9PSEU|nr:hypothetical protein [Amycolatopsis thailandensis]OXM41307.1 hypothetical protein CFP71_42755 [Amycolatopsis thailandensis]